MYSKVWIHSEISDDYLILIGLAEENEYLLAFDEGMSSRINLSSMLTCLQEILKQLGNLTLSLSDKG